ncbi:tetratricopeptide repeat protein, partial [Thiotrichales bacterium HSG1]|nr:tetratricopeptide repeat protein [Thiotrichales bacterium HSG1]
MKYLAVLILSIAVTTSNIDELHNDAKQAFYASDYTTAITKWQKALDLAKQHDNKADISKFLVNLGAVSYSTGKYQAALQYFQQAVFIDQELNDKNGQSADHHYLGLIYYKLQDYKAALQHYQLALTLQAKINISQDSTLSSIGMVYDSIGAYQQAIKYYKQVSAPPDTIGDASKLSNLGVAYKNLSDYPTALNYFKKALKIAKRLGYKTIIANNIT